MAGTSSSHQSQPAAGSNEEIIQSKYRQVIIKNRVNNLPATIQNRVTVLKNVELKRTGIESDYWKEFMQLQEKYHKKQQILMGKRKKIVTGVVDPPKEAPKWQTQKEKKGNPKDLEAFQPTLKKFKQLPRYFKGIPNFWAIVLRNCETFNMRVCDHDVPALQKLLDVKVKIRAEGFTLEFLFGKNEYFTDTVLTKKYYVKLPVDDPFDCDGPIIFKCQGCNITWKKNKDLTVLTIRRKNSKECEPVRRASFFNFFDPPVIPEGASTVDSATHQILAADYKVGHMLREIIIPKAVLFYSGDRVPDETDGAPNGGQKPKN